MSRMVMVSGKTSVVICAYTEERWDDLVAAVQSIQQQKTPPHEIILVIDHNAALFERARACISNVIVIESREPKGLSGARNSGIAIARGSLIAFLDDDAIAEPDWLERLEACCQQPEVLGAGGVVKPLWTGQRPTWFPEEFYWVIGCTYQDFSDTTVIRNPYGGCTCFRREVFEAVGFFRNGLGRVGTKLLGGEETELCARAKQYWLEKVFLCEPRAVIHHHIRPHRANWRYFLSRCYGEGLSKAAITRFVGVRDGLSSEYIYALQTLPQGILGNVMHALTHRDSRGFLKAGAIVVGLVMTVAGYIGGVVSNSFLSPTGTCSQAAPVFTFSERQEPGVMEPQRNG